jgi:hypothetical protein
MESKGHISAPDIKELQIMISQQNGGLLARRSVDRPSRRSQNQLSKKLRSFRLLDGCFNFRSALASI